MNSEPISRIKKGNEKMFINNKLTYSNKEISLFVEGEPTTQQQKHQQL